MCRWSVGMIRLDTGLGRRTTGAHGCTAIKILTEFIQVKTTLFRAILCIPGHSTGGCQTKQSITQIRSPQYPSRSPRAKAAVATSCTSSGLPSRRLPRRERPVVPQHVVVALGDGDRGALEEVLLPPLGLPEIHSITITSPHVLNSAALCQKIVCVWQL